jgi:hypothetical protein
MGLATMEYTSDIVHLSHSGEVIRNLGTATYAIDQYEDYDANVEQTQRRKRSFMRRTLSQNEDDLEGGSDEESERTGRTEGIVARFTNSFTNLFSRRNQEGSNRSQSSRSSELEDSKHLREDF